MKNFYGANNVIAQTDSNYKVELASSFSNKVSTYVDNPFQMPAKWREQLLFRSINVQAENAYLVSKKQRSYFISPAG